MPTDCPGWPRTWRRWPAMRGCCWTASGPRRCARACRRRRWRRRGRRWRCSCRMRARPIRRCRAGRARRAALAPWTAPAWPRRCGAAGPSWTRCARWWPIAWPGPRRGARRWTAAGPPAGAPCWRCWRRPGCWPRWPGRCGSRPGKAGRWTGCSRPRLWRRAWTAMRPLPTWARGSTGCGGPRRRWRRASRGCGCARWAG